jgi:hypothetical protein
MSATQGSAAFNSTGYALVSARSVYDQATGTSWEYVYEGLQANIATLASTLQASGARTVVTPREDGRAQLSANFVRDPTIAATSEVAQEQWSIEWEDERPSIFNHPVVVAEAAILGTDGQSSYQAEIKRAVQDGEANPFASSLATYPLSQIVWAMLASGDETYPRYRPLLRRVSSYSLTYTGTPHRVDVKGKVYTRASLLSAFGIVSPLADRIPEDPIEAPPSGFVYGWFLAEQSFQYVRERGAVKVNETLGFRWGTWNAAASGALYQLV